MFRKSWIYFIAILMVSGLFFSVGCSTKVEKEDVDITTEADIEEKARLEAERRAKQEADKIANTQEMRRKAMERAAKRARQEAAKKASDRRKLQEVAKRGEFLNTDIYFEYNKSTLRYDSKEELVKKAEYMNKNLDIYVVIEGHCDERGSEEYNLALGEKRAKTAKDYLVDLGVSPLRIKTVSYGEERPVDPRSSEEAWARNRRAHFVIE